MEQMNLKIQSVLSDIDGVSGIRIIEAILSGERDPHKLVSLRDRYIKASEETVIKSLEGRWTGEHLFSLKVQYETYKFNKARIAECDVRIAELLTEEVKKRITAISPAESKKTRKKMQKCRQKRCCCIVAPYNTV
jgi:hypothetical protein